MKKNILLSFILLFGSTFMPAQISVPDKITGNWIHEKNNTWDYGFFEKFAVYQSAFWDYETIDVHKKYTDVVLRKGGQRIFLKISILSDGLITVVSDKGKVKYKLNKPGFFPYTTPDHTPLKTGGFKNDSVTITGYYRNLDKLTRENAPQARSGPFNVFVQDFIQDKTVKYYADFDSAGRFKITFPVMYAQEIALDWGRLSRVCVVEPGEELFLFADLEDWIQTEAITGLQNMENYMRRPKRILYMGAHARFHNEVARYTPSYSFTNRNTLARNVSSDMEYARAAYENYKSRIDYLEAYIRNNPVLSDRFREYEEASEKYRFGYNLVQYRFNKFDQGKVAFDPGYIDFVNDSIPLYESGNPATFIRDYSDFMRDYVEYYQDLSDKQEFDETSKQWRTVTTSINSDEIMDEVEKRNVLTKEEDQVVAQFEEFQRKLPILKDTAARGTLIRASKKLMADYNSILQGSKVRAITLGLVTVKSFKRQFKLIDSLVLNKDLKELLFAREFCAVMDNQKQALSEILLELLGNQISHPVIRGYVISMNNHFADLSKKGFAYEASLKNTAHLKEAANADALFQELIAPYKGKAIYVDFWGTWCGPCRQQMKYVGNLKKELADKDVIFMYLANNSPEESWKNVIKEMDLTGENVVHYRLSDEQQGMIERKFAVDSWPTYMLVNKEGKVVNNDAPKPQFATEVINAISSVLQEQ
jgi:thiol-disulfide isomerase/thioredoxin